MIRSTENNKVQPTGWVDLHGLHVHEAVKFTQQALEVRCCGTLCSAMCSLALAVPSGRSRSRFVRAAPYRRKGPPLSVPHCQDQARRGFVHTAQTAERPGGPAQRRRPGRSAALTEDETERLSATLSEWVMLWELRECISGSALRNCLFMLEYVSFYVRN